MKRFPILTVIGLVLCAIFVGMARGAASDVKRENPVQEARRWVDHLSGMTVERVRRELGQPTSEKQWKSNRFGGPLLVYEFTPESKLQLFVHDGEVSSALLTVQSK